MIMLSTTVIDSMDNVSAAKTNFKDFMSDNLARTNGMIDAAYPEMKAKTDAKMTVVCGANPACVPMVTPTISPIIHPARQCKLADSAICLIEFFVLQ